MRNTNVNKALGFLTLILMLRWCGTCNGQIVWEPWVTVPLSECNGCGIPVDNNAACDNGGVLVCERRDGKYPWYPLAGVPKIKNGNTIQCDYCPACCADCSCDPEMLQSISCGVSTATYTESIVASSASPRLSPGSALIVGVKLTTCVGYTGQTCTATCDATANLCMKVKTTAQVPYFTGVAFSSSMSGRHPECGLPCRTRLVPFVQSQEFRGPAPLAHRTTVFS